MRWFKDAYDTFINIPLVDENMTLKELSENAPYPDPSYRHILRDEFNNPYYIQLQKFGGIAKGNYSVRVNEVDQGFRSGYLKVANLLREV